MLLGVEHSGIAHTTPNKFKNRALFLPLGHSNPDQIRNTPFRPDRNLKTLAFHVIFQPVKHKIEKK